MHTPTQGDCFFFSLYGEGMPVVSGEARLVTIQSWLTELLSWNAISGCRSVITFLICADMKCHMRCLISVYCDVKNTNWSLQWKCGLEFVLHILQFPCRYSFSCKNKNVFSNWKWLIEQTTWLKCVNLSIKLYWKAITVCICYLKKKNPTRNRSDSLHHGCSVCKTACSFPQQSGLNNLSSTPKTRWAAMTSSTIKSQYLNTGEGMISLHALYALVVIWQAFKTTASITSLNWKSPDHHQHNSQKSLRRWSQIQDSSKDKELNFKYC